MPARAELVALLRSVAEQGDPARGEEVFRRDALRCVTCHAIGGAGGKVGPDLSSLGGSSQLVHIVESLLEPSAKMKEGFEPVVVIDKAGVIHSGTATRRADDGIELHVFSLLERGNTRPHCLHLDTPIRVVQQRHQGGEAQTFNALAGSAGQVDAGLGAWFFDGLPKDVFLNHEFLPKGCECGCLSDRSVLRQKRSLYQPAEAFIVPQRGFSPGPGDAQRAQRWRTQRPGSTREQTQLHEARSHRYPAQSAH